MNKYIMPPRLSTSFSKRGKTAKKRFENIFDKRIKKRGYAPFAAAIACSVALGGCFAANVPSEPVSMLILGTDDSGVRYDVLMLCTLDEGLSITQLPRDTYVQGGKLGGMDKRQISEAVSELTGVYTDNYVTVSLDGFRNIIDAAAGVKFSVPMDMEYDDPYQGLSISLSAGEQTLDGSGAEMLMRYRKGNTDETTGRYYGYDNGDIDRLGVQRDLYMVIADKLIAEGVSAELAGAVTDNIETDLSPTEIAALIKRASELDMEDIKIELLGGEWIENDPQHGTVYIPR